MAPSEAGLLCGLRIVVGGLLLYSHLIWGMAGSEFLSLSRLPPVDFSSADLGLYLYQKGEALVGWRGLYAAAFFSYLLMTVGLFSRLTTATSTGFAIAFSNRFADFAFGLDTMLITLGGYLCFASVGDDYSLDRYLRRIVPKLDFYNTLARRLIQIHLAIVYLSSGFAKLTGSDWIDGTALWKIVASPEYQSLDLTWLAPYPLVLNLMTWSVVAWECSYAFLIWPNRTRFVIVAAAVSSHLFIALALGMAPFGLLMAAANGLVFSSRVGNYRPQIVS